MRVFRAVHFPVPEMSETAWLGTLTKTALLERVDNVVPRSVSRKHKHLLFDTAFLRDDRSEYVQNERDGVSPSPREEKAIREKRMMYACRRKQMACS